MRLGLNGATIMRSPIEDDIEIASECGYDALEIWAGKLDTYSVNAPMENLAARMGELGLVPWCINSVENITCRGSTGRAEVLEELRRRVADAAVLGAPSIVVVPSCRDEPISHQDAVGHAVEVLRAMSDVSGDVALAFEFLGKPGCTVPALGMAIEIVEQVDRPNVGLVIDTFHFYAGGSDLADLQRVPLDKLLVVHLNGCEDLPRSELTDAHRLYPGEGSIPIASILKPLHDRGYDGVASIEIFRPEYWNQDPREVAQTALGQATTVLADVGYSGYQAGPN